MKNKYNLLLLVIASIFMALPACNNAEPIPEHPNFTEHVAGVLYKNCSICHRPNGGAHFNLLGYEDARRYAGAIAFVTKERMMPPWPADPNYTHFKGERLLTENEIQLLAKWAADGAPEGPKDKLAAVPLFPSGSLIGTPDLRIAVQPYFIKANSTDQFLLVKVPFELPEDKNVAVVEFVPGSSGVVHHVNGDLVKYDFQKKRTVFEGINVVDMAKDTSRLMQAYEKLGLPNDDGSYPELQKSVVNYLPGAEGQRYPAGIGGYVLPRKGAFLFNDLHYGFTNKNDITDSSFINIFYSKTPPQRPVREFQLGTLGAAPVLPDLVIQPDSVKFVSSRLVIKEDISILTINPHMHLLGKMFKAYALTPNKDTIRLISIPKWDFNWQYFYTFKKMMKVPAGSTIVAEGVYDNTRQNLNNPFSPPQLITDQNGSMKATDEMFQFIVTYLPYENGDEKLSL